MKETGKSKQDRKQVKSLASEALRHPLRVRILEVVNERDISPIQFMNQQLAPSVGVSSKALSSISYHFRALAKSGCIELVDTFARRGATEHVYRGTVRAYFTDEEWMNLSDRERCLVSRTVYQGLAARTEGAMMCHTFDSRPDRHLTWVAMEIDERGWTELMATLAGAYEDVTRIRRNAEERATASGERAVPVTVGLLGFESPPPPPQA